MPARRKSRPTITSKYLLDRLDYQFYAASLALKRLRIGFAADARDFKVDIRKEIKELEYRFQILRRRLKELAALRK